MNPIPYQQASGHLAAVDDDWADLIAVVGPCTHEPKPAREPYEALIRAVAYQQLHAKAGDAILRKLLAACGGGAFPAPEELLATDPAALRSCGLSSRKVETVRSIAEGALSGLVPKRSTADNMTDEDLIKQLVTLKGIGRWTVEMLLIYTMERSDVLPADDFGVREGYRRLKRLPKALSPKAMAEKGVAWSPFRTVGAWYLWRVPREK